MRIIFFGTPQFAAACLNAVYLIPGAEVKAVVTQPDRPAGRGQKVQSCPVKKIAETKNSPIVQPNDIKKNPAEFLSSVSKYGPFDIGIVVAFGQILPQSVLDLPRLGCVNVHASLLPRWRGAAPIQRALLAGDLKTGVCLMRLEAGLDTGPVFSRSEIEISADDTFQTLHDRLSELGANLLSSDLPQIASASLVPIPQPMDGITYAPKILGSEAKLDWNRSAVELERQIRAFNPVPGAFTSLQGRRLKVFGSKNRANPEHAQNSLPPGSVLHPKDGLNNSPIASLDVQTGNGILSLTEVQLEGKQRMPVSEFLRGQKSFPDLFDSV